MDVFGICICAICCALFGAVLKKSNQEYSLLLSLATVAVILIVVVNRAQPLFLQLQDLANSQGFDEAYLSLLLRAVGISILGQTCIFLCKDAGEQSLAYGVNLACKCGILVISLPVISRIFALIAEVLSSVG